MVLELPVAASVYWSWGPARTGPLLCLMKPQSPPWVYLAAGAILPPAVAAAPHVEVDQLPPVEAATASAAALLQYHHVLAAESSGPVTKNSSLP